MNQKNPLDVRLELEEIGPLLATIAKTNPISPPPDDYFDEVEKRILSQIALAGHDTPLAQVPAGYFEKLETKIMSHDSARVSEKQVYTMRNWKMYAIAASMILISAVMIVFKMYQSPSALPDTTSVPTQDEYLQYMTDHIDEFDINMLTEQQLVEESDVQWVTYDMSENDLEKEEILPESEINF